MPRRPHPDLPRSRPPAPADALPPPHRRRRELGQNHLHDAAVTRHLVDALGLPAQATSPLVVELAAGHGAVTTVLVGRGHRVEAVELDPAAVRVLRSRLRRQRAAVAGATPRVRVVRADLLRHRFPDEPFRVLANLPFGRTTQALRLLLDTPGWDRAVLLVQWEVARRRSTRVRGTDTTSTTLLSASAAPWFDLEATRRVPASAFRPVPAVDGGVLVISRRSTPLLPEAERERYRRLVRSVFEGSGVGVVGILRRHLPRREVEHWARAHGVARHALPRDLDVWAWVDLYQRVSGRAGQPGVADVRTARSPSGRTPRSRRRTAGSARPGRRGPRRSG